MEPINPPIHTYTGASFTANNKLFGVRVPKTTSKSTKPPTIKLTKAAISGAFKNPPNFALILACTGNKQPRTRANNIKKYLIEIVNLKTKVEIFAN